MWAKKLKTSVIISFIFTLIFISSNYFLYSNNDEINKITDIINAQQISTLSGAGRLLHPLSERYGIKFYITDIEASSYAKQWAEWKEIENDDIKELSAFLNLFIDEWNKYPVSWVKNSNLKAIAFVKNLRVVGQFRSAMPDAYGEVLYYDIGYAYAGDTYQKMVIHHEYYHMIEENYFGSMYYKDEEWDSFNPPDFEYGEGGSSAYEEENYSNKEHPRQGFIDNYSMYGLEEDKAQVYAYIMTTPLYNKLMKWIETDTILAKKVRYMKKFMQKHSPEINEAYFYKIHNLHISEDQRIAIPSDNEDATDVVMEEQTMEGERKTIDNETAFKELLSTITDYKTKTGLKNFYKGGIGKKIDNTGLTANKLINKAKEYLGTPHKFGGESKSGIDCSGLLMVVFRSFNIGLPHNSEEQARYGNLIIYKKDLKKGDLVFFINTYKTSRFITHSGIYLGDNNFIHTSSKRGVIISSLDNPYWKPKYIFATRLL